MIVLKPNEIRTSPFPHFIQRKILDDRVAHMLLDWFESRAPWEPKEIPDFYRLANLRLREKDLPPHVAPLASFRTYDVIACQMESIFGVRLLRNVDISAHRLRDGESMGVHTDYGPVGQTHRLLIQLNRGWTMQNGGMLMLFDEESPSAPSSAHRYYLPISQSGFGFAISTNSFHAISPIIGQDRYTLVYSFTSVLQNSA